ncbi:Dolichyl-diphosphooligosaccharide--protein glycosyltransferase subunit [Nymphaea thermarum]|nr:Dolichyl-diphosphooligosaccharide--protein glycosyltransferase subunit [Nymphaea thermarum]
MRYEREKSDQVLPSFTADQSLFPVTFLATGPSDLDDSGAIRLGQAILPTKFDVDGTADDVSGGDSRNLAEISGDPHCFSTTGGCDFPTPFDLPWRDRLAILGDLRRHPAAGGNLSCGFDRREHSNVGLLFRVAAIPGAWYSPRVLLVIAKLVLAVQDTDKVSRVSGKCYSMNMGALLLLDADVERGIPFSCQDLSPERAFADFVLCNLVLHLVIMNFLG